MDQGNENFFTTSRSHDQDDCHALYGKNPLKISSPEPKGEWPWGLVCSIGDMGPIKFEKITTYS